MKNLNFLKIFGVSIVIVALSFDIFSQTKTDLEKVVETEYAFARFADEKGVKAAFLEFLTDDALMFNPQAVNAKEMWRARPDDSPATLSWRPTFADVSSDGALAYTIGEGAFRPKGKSDANVYYSTYASIWRRQPDGNYKAVMDVGITHDKPPTADEKTTAPKPSGKIADKIKSPAAAINKFFETATAESLEKSYQKFAAKDARFLREGEFPTVGVKARLRAAKNPSKIAFGEPLAQQNAGDLAYVIAAYEMKTDGKTTDKGNVIQIWKFLKNKWQIVADVFAPMPVEGK